MRSKRNKFCIAAGIVSLLMSIADVVVTVMLYTDNAYKVLADIIDSVPYEGATLAELLNYMKIYMIITSVVCVLISVLLIVLGSRKAPVSNKVLVPAAIFLAIFGAGLISLILLICAMFASTQPAAAPAGYTAPAAQTPVEPPKPSPQQTTTKELEDKVRNLKILKENGSISEEEYNELLKNLFK